MEPRTPLAVVAPPTPTATSMTAPDMGRLVLGVVAVTLPRLPVRLLGGRDSTAVRRTVRVLGARYLAQSLGSRWLQQPGRQRQRRVRELDASVDLVHAASMLVLARIRPRHRRLALASATVASGFALGDLAGRSAT